MRVDEWMDGRGGWEGWMREVNEITEWLDERMNEWRGEWMNK